MKSFSHRYKDKFVSVVLASFNGQDFIKKQLESILNQTHTNLEVLVVDDGSSDKTTEIIKEFLLKDERVHFFPAAKNHGLVKNFERGLKLAKGEFIALADQDDIFDKYKIEKQLSAIIDDAKADMVITDLELIDENDRKLAESMWMFQGIAPEKTSPFRRLCIDNYVTGCSSLFSRRLLEHASPFPSGLKIHDQWLAVVAARKDGGGIKILNEQLTQYRQHNRNLIGAKRSNKLSWCDVGSKLFSLNELKVIRENSSKIFDEKRIRIISFFERSELFDEDELTYLKSLEELFFNFSIESNNRSLKRISLMPKAVYFSFYARSFWQTLFRFVILLVPPINKRRQNSQ
ncbi:MAG: glycosyltransferase family 2 protein [Methylophaga sp.]|nr:glycosyltransferase family 2 protein [Methylophaga sp.]